MASKLIKTEFEFNSFRVVIIREISRYHGYVYDIKENNNPTAEFISYISLEHLCSCIENSLGIDVSTFY